MKSIAVIADPDHERLARLTFTLQAAGFRVAGTLHDGDLLQLLAEEAPHVLIVSTTLVGVLPAGSRGTVSGSASPPALAPRVMEAGVPVLLLAERNCAPSPGLLESFGVSDYIRASAPTEELLHRVATLIHRDQERSGRRNNSERLRERLRQVSAGIRSTNDPRLMVEELVQGIGTSFGADHVWFTTFDDERVPLVTAQWNKDDLASLPSALGSHTEAVRRGADRLWAQATLLTFDGHLNHQPAPHEQELLAWAEDVNAQTSVVAPVGEGQSAFGVIWILNVQESRQWSTTETALIRHVLGNLSHGLIQGHLINAQQQVLRRLHQLDQAKTDFLATVNHELRTPLTSITACLDMIRDNDGESVPPGIARRLGTIERNSDRLRRLIEDMLTVSRHDRNTECRKAPINLEHLLRMVVTALRPMAAARNVNISLDHAGEELITSANEAQLEQVFTNLVSNAIKFTDSGGEINITAGPTGNEGQAPMILVEVADNGIGIPEEEIPQLFLRFFRASNASRARIPGTGLGLAIAHGIVTQHQGTITVTSTLGRGTVFTVHLPLYEESPLPLHEEGEALRAI